MAEVSNQGSLRQQTRRKSTRRSAVWNHFVDFKDDKGNDKVQCKRCQQVLGASTRNGTSTLLAHVRRCWGNEAAAAAAAEQAPSRSSSASEDLARMVALRGYDPSFVEDDYFRSFVGRLDPEFEVPSRVAIEEMCDGIFDETRRDLLDRLTRTPDGRFSLAVGKTKTPEAGTGEVTYVTCHFIDDEWKLHKLVQQAFLPEVPPHVFEDGPILGFDMDPDVDEHVFSFVLEHDGRLSVVAYDITDHDRRNAVESWNKEMDSDTNLRWTTTSFVDNVLHSTAECLLPDQHFTIEMYDDMMDLNLTRQERLRLLSELDLDYEQAYDHRWCACYYSLEVLGKRGFNKFADAELFVKLLCKVWKQVYRGIQKISASTCPTSNLCLAELLALREVLQHEIATIDEQYKHYQSHAQSILSDASDNLNKALQGWYLIWSVPLVLDPRYKLSFVEFSFKRAFGSKAGKNIAEVTTKIKDLYADYVKEYGTITDADHSSIANAATASAGPLEQAWNEHCRSQGVLTSTQDNGSYPEAQTELDRYLQDRQAPAAEDFDLLSWWKVHSSEYPMVARMARDALAMPTCSKLSSDQLAQVRSILRGYSKKPFSELSHI